MFFNLSIVSGCNNVATKTPAESAIEFNRWVIQYAIGCFFLISPLKAQKINVIDNIPITSNEIIIEISNLSGSEASIELLKIKVAGNIPKKNP